MSLCQSNLEDYDDLPLDPEEDGCWWSDGIEALYHYNDLDILTLEVKLTRE